MAQESGNKSHKRSADEALGSEVVNLPPACLSDFVIHYRHTAFQVHKFVLCYHSSYFPKYIGHLIHGQRAYPTDECDEHPAIPHCIRLPDSCGKVEADCDDCCVFLCHLYFAQHYNCIPYRMADAIDLAADPEHAVTLTHPRLNNWQKLKQAISSEGCCCLLDPSALYEAVMSLCHYFDCAVVPKRAEDNCLLAVELGSEYHAELTVGARVTVLPICTAVRPEATEGGLHSTARDAKYALWRSQGGVGECATASGQRHCV